MHAGICKRSSCLRFLGPDGFCCCDRKSAAGVVVFLLEVVLDLLGLRQPIFWLMAFLSERDRLVALWGL